jgi:hypothetical protein
VHTGELCREPNFHAGFVHDSGTNVEATGDKGVREKDRREELYIVNTDSGLEGEERVYW